MGKVKLGLIQ
uniref:Uncharacterized protein n=1 Tax=Arundo donax TaxID=35708 RepID=A0A0A9BQT3_ARUDO